MELRNILTFSRVAELNSFTKATEELGYSQSTVTIQIQQLEKELEQANDLNNLEEQARDQLRLIKPGETIYIFPDDITKPDKDAEDTEE